MNGTWFAFVSNCLICPALQLKLRKNGGKFKDGAKKIICDLI